jgi:hypothetical protein
VGLGSDVGTGGEEQLDHARVPVPRRPHERRPPPGKKWGCRPMESRRCISDSNRGEHKCDPGRSHERHWRSQRPNRTAA